MPLVESLAIMRYITNTHSLDENWYPKEDPMAQQKVEEYLHWQHINTRAMCAKYFQGYRDSISNYWLRNLFHKYT